MKSWLKNSYHTPKPLAINKKADSDKELLKLEVKQQGIT